MNSSTNFQAGESVEWDFDLVAGTERLKDGDLAGKDYRTGRGIRIRCEGGKIVAIEDVEVADEAEWIAPALFELQVNGYGGVDFQQANLGKEQLKTAAEALERDGCAQTLLTLVTDHWEPLTQKISQVRKMIEEEEILRRQFAGFHIEGPFLSPEPGYCGAHPKEAMGAPTIEKIQELHRIMKGLPVLLTLAPEWPGSPEAIAEAVRLGIRVSLGHTKATPDHIAAAVKAGATGFTHLGNGCPQQLDRHQNVIWSALDTPELTIGIIPDTIHVTPALFRIFSKIRESGSFYYTTDAMAAAGAPPGRYTIGRLEVEVGEDKIVRQPGQTNFAGSALETDEAVRRSAKMLGVSWRKTWDGISVRPANFMGIPWGLEVGSPASFCRIREK